MQQRTLVIGDIHGMYDELRLALKYVDYTPSDALIFLGDYINRGAQSREVLDFLIELRNNPGTIFIRGNHEEIILQLAEGNTEYWYMWLEYGEGRACLRSYGVDPNRLHSMGTDYFYHDGNTNLPLNRRDVTMQFLTDLFPEEHLQFIRNTVITHETEEYFFCHAGLEKGISLHEQTLYTDYFLLWGDEDFLHDEQDYGKTIVFGHYHMKQPFIQFKKIGIALQDAVAVFDINNRIIMDSDSHITEVEGAL